MQIDPGSHREPTLEMELRYLHPVYSADTEASELVELVDSASLFEVARDALAAISPRKRFATKFGVTVGSVRATKGGQYYIGPRELPDGLAKLAELRASGRLGNYYRHYWGEAFTVDVGFFLTLPARGKYEALDVSRAVARVRIEDQAVEPWLEQLSNAMFDLFVKAASVGRPMHARCSWFFRSGNHEYERLAGVFARDEVGLPSVPGYRTILYLHPAAVLELGGVDAVAAHAPVAVVRPLDHPDGSIGIAAMLCRNPDDLTVNRLEAWRQYLLPVVNLPQEHYRPTSWADFRPEGWLAGVDRPLDVLPRDFEGL